MTSVLPESRVGLGCAPIGDIPGPVAEAEALETVSVALAHGVRFFDTAPHYGAGLSETRLGMALEGVPRDSYTLATKVGRVIVDADGRPVPKGAQGQRTIGDLSYDGVMKSLESSFERLRTDRIDLLYLHDPDDVDVALEGAYRALMELRDQGVVRAIGVGMNHSEPLARFCVEAAPDVVMIAGEYTLLERNAEKVLFPGALETGTSVVAAGVFNSGILANPVDGSTFGYRRATQETLKRAQEFGRLAASFGVPLSALAVQFSLSHPAVTGTVIGAKKPYEVLSFLEDVSIEIPRSLMMEVGGHV